jgi:GT2 family glycosyltransferase
VSLGFLPRALTANLGVRREAYEAIEGFNEEHDYGAPDTDFCWRLQLAGFRLDYLPEATVHYRHRDTNRDIWVKSFKTGRSVVRLYRDFGERGMPQGSIPGACLRWGQIVLGAPVALVSRARRAAWIEKAGLAAGRLAGSREFGVRYL